MTKSKAVEDNIIFNLLIYFVGFSAIHSAWQGYQDFLSYVFNPETYILFSIVIIIYYIVLITFHIYTIVLLVKEKNNSIFSTKLLFIFLIIINLIQLLWIYYTKEGYEFIFWIVVWTIFYFVFIIYLYKSKEIIEKFPKNKSTKKSIAIILFILTLILSLFLWLTLFGVQHLVNKGIIQK